MSISWACSSWTAGPSIISISSLSLLRMAGRESVMSISCTCSSCMADQASSAYLSLLFGTSPREHEHQLCVFFEDSRASIISISSLCSLARGRPRERHEHQLHLFLVYGRPGIIGISSFCILAHGRPQEHHENQLRLLFGDSRPSIISMSSVCWPAHGSPQKHHEHQLGLFFVDSRDSIIGISCACSLRTAVPSIITISSVWFLAAGRSRQHHWNQLHLFFADRRANAIRISCAFVGSCESIIGITLRTAGPSIINISSVCSLARESIIGVSCTFSLRTAGASIISRGKPHKASLQSSALVLCGQRAKHHQVHGKHHEHQLRLLFADSRPRIVNISSLGPIADGSRRGPHEHQLRLLSADSPAKHHQHQLRLGFWSLAGREDIMSISCACSSRTGKLIVMMLGRLSMKNRLREYQQHQLHVLFGNRFGKKKASLQLLILMLKASWGDFG
ncbi:hypothetical protein AK812_SmicGene22637 [Symbiodinium microadriaticum]|uniref:Uncharacterized protein n=1 Tax=Symbiodinium microadriaticum TaxID=2951 RepID=A0A1Q9DJB8_SYMMI|nr:hypothetical protein AK812_SmicGene22637 [Symbiodinium microadriaticum]